MHWWVFWRISTTSILKTTHSMGNVNIRSILNSWCCSKGVFRISLHKMGGFTANRISMFEPSVFLELRFMRGNIHHPMFLTWELQFFLEKNILPKTNIALENWWMEDDFLLKWSRFKWHVRFRAVYSQEFGLPRVLKGKSGGGGGEGSIKLLMVKRKSWRAPRNIQGMWSLIRRKWCGISSTTSSRYLVVSSLYPQHVQKVAEISSCQLRFFQPSNTLQITPVPYVVLKRLGFASAYPCCIDIFWIHPPPRMTAETTKKSNTL